MTLSFAWLLPFDLVLVLDCVDFKSRGVGFGLVVGFSSWRSSSFRFLLLVADILVGWSDVVALPKKASARSFSAGLVLRFRVEATRGAREVGFVEALSCSREGFLCLSLRLTDMSIWVQDTRESRMKAESVCGEEGKG